MPRQILITGASVAFYPAPLDNCTAEGEQVLTQPGGLFGGWITSNITGPFKAKPGRMGW